MPAIGDDVQKARSAATAVLVAGPQLLLHARMSSSDEDLSDEELSSSASGSGESGSDDESSSSSESSDAPEETAPAASKRRKSSPEPSARVARGGIDLSSMALNAPFCPCGA